MALRCLAAGFSAGLATAGAKSCVEVPGPGPQGLVEISEIS